MKLRIGSFTRRDWGFRAETAGRQFETADWDFQTADFNGARRGAAQGRNRQARAAKQLLRALRGRRSKKSGWVEWKDMLNWSGDIFGRLSQSWSRKEKNDAPRHEKTKTGCWTTSNFETADQRVKRAKVNRGDECFQFRGFGILDFGKTSETQSRQGLRDALRCRPPNNVWMGR